MADNVTIPATGSGDATPKVACDELTYSGDTAKLQLVRQVHVSGSEGSKTLTEIAAVHDAADPDGTNGIGMRATAHGANPTAVAAADRTVLRANRHGIPFVIGGHPNAKSATYLWTGSTTDDNVLPAISSGTKYAITRITITIDEATTVGVAVRLGFGTANVPALPSANADAVDDILVYHPGLVPGAGIQIGDGTGILGVGGDGAELRITAEATTGGTGVVTVTYFTIES